jgi:Na+/H+ antiporter NhaD/arsenite permease-like protein
MAWVALGIFVIAFIFISIDKISSAVVALAGAVLCICLGIIKQQAVYTSIDWNVILLLISMMVIINITKTTGVFQFLAVKTAKLAKGDPIKILIMLSLLTAVISAFLDNVTTVLIIAPVAMTIAAELSISSAPFLICLALTSNIGGTATLIGDPPNIMVGSAADLSFGLFFESLAPIILIILVVFSFIATMLFRKQLVVSAEKKQRIMEIKEEGILKDLPLLWNCGIVLALTIVSFFLNTLIGVDESTIAMGGAVLLMLCYGNRGLINIFKEIEWETIIFFVGLFVLVGALVDQGVIALCSKYLIDVTHGNFKIASVLILWVSGIISALVNNIPYMATMIPLIEGFAKGASAETAHPLWWALSLGACLGGNGTLIGASANVIVASLAQKDGHRISFAQFTKYGALITLISMLLCTAYILIRYYA